MEVDTGIDEQSRKEIAEGLAGVLADTFTLLVKTQGYHWNVSGPRFASLHLMFEQQYVELQGAIDEVAERMRALGSFAPGSLAELSALATIPDEQRVPEDAEMVRRLAEGHQTIARLARMLVPVAEDADDVATADLLTSRMHAHEKAAWMLRSSLG